MSGASLSSPRFLVPELPTTGTVALPAAESQHCVSVLRLPVGAKLVLFDGQGGEALGTLAEANKRGCQVAIQRRTDTDRELPGRLELLVALPKGDRQKQMIDGLTQLGVARLAPLQTQRGVAQPTANALERLSRMVAEASKQCGRNRLMEIGPAVSVASLVQSDAPERVVSLVAHPYGDAHSDQAPKLSATGDCRVAIGPEGGFTDAEVESLLSHGWQTIRLGPRILRVEIAAIAIAATFAAQFNALVADGR